MCVGNNDRCSLKCVTPNTKYPTRVLEKLANSYCTLYLNQKSLKCQQKKFINFRITVFQIKVYRSCKEIVRRNRVFKKKLGFSKPFCTLF